MYNLELRSDTFTKPTPAMLDAMMNANVGDDVFEEDETTKSLERKCAAMFGYEDALLCLSGTMANQIAITAHAKAGEEVICDALSHIYLYEGGGIMANAHASVSLLQGNRGRLTASLIEDVIKPDNVHYPVSTLVSLENTVNKGGGSIYAIEEIKQIKQLCIKHNMRLHLDGARLFNALVETKESPLEHGALFDSITICLSKGLGAPMGTVLLGNTAFIHQARRIRKRFGGGWRQSGYIAAAGIYALDHHIDRLADDHRRAQECRTHRRRQWVERSFDTPQRGHCGWQHLTWLGFWLGFWFGFLGWTFRWTTNGGLVSSIYEGPSSPIPTTVKLLNLP